MTCGPELNIPDAALDAAVRTMPEGHVAGADMPEIASDVIRAATPLIVAAELQRLADDLEVTRQEMREVDDRTVRSSGMGEAIRLLRVRADELGRGL